MLVIVFLATKGGAGRTTALVAVASGLVALARRVLVLDATPQRHWPTGLSTLQRWEAGLRVDGVDAHDLGVAAVRGSAALLDRLARAARDGWDAVLVDTSADLDDEAAAALLRADLVVCSFTNDHVAALVGAGVSERAAGLVTDGTPVRGLATGLRGRAHDHEAARAAFRDAADGDVLVSELPGSELLGFVATEGHLPALVHSRASGAWSGPTFDLPVSRAGQAWRARTGARAALPLSFAEQQDDRRAWAACLELACEVLWAAQGLTLQAPSPLSSCHPSLRRPAGPADRRGSTDAARTPREAGGGARA
jgi:cellulose biosynthesis protein BcsQ